MQFVRGYIELNPDPHPSLVCRECGEHVTPPSVPSEDPKVADTRGNAWTNVWFWLMALVVVGAPTGLFVLYAQRVGGLVVLALAVPVATAVVGFLVVGLREWTLWANERTGWPEGPEGNGWRKALWEQSASRKRRPWDFVFRPATMAVGTIETFGAMLAGYYFMTLQLSDRWQITAVIGGWFTVKSIAVGKTKLDTDERLFFGNQIRYFFVFGTLMSIALGFAIGLAYHQMAPDAWILR